MSFFTNRILKKLHNAIIEGDLSTLKKQFSKLNQADLEQHRFNFQEQHCNAQELAIISGQAKALEHLLQAGCSLQSSTETPLLYQALRQREQSLALLTVLLQANAAMEYPNTTPDHALLACFKYCPDSTLMLHLSRLNEYGADLNYTDTSGYNVLMLALQKEQQALVQMLINSGAELPASFPEGWCSEEILHYAKRCAEDLKIRQIMLG